MANVTHEHIAYKRKWRNSGYNQFNGAYYYSQEIVQNIMPRVETDRSWITVNVQGVGASHSILFVHNNKHPENYDWLKRYGFKDIILVCGIPETVEKVQHLGTPIYLPISIDVDYVKQFRVEDKTKKAAFVGRPVKRRGMILPDDIDFLEGLPRPELLRRMAEYETVYAVGRCAIEAKVLGCKLKPYDPRFPKVSRWKILDNKKAAKMLQAQLDEIEGR